MAKWSPSALTWHGLPLQGCKHDRSIPALAPHATFLLHYLLFHYARRRSDERAPRARAARRLSGVRPAFGVSSRSNTSGAPRLRRAPVGPLWLRLTKKYPGRPCALAGLWRER